MNGRHPTSEPRITLTLALSHQGRGNRTCAPSSTGGVRQRSPFAGMTALREPALAGRRGVVELGADQVLGRLPFGEPGTDDDGLDDQHDLVAVGVVRPQLRALAGVQPALEQRAQDRRGRPPTSPAPPRCARFRFRPGSSGRAGVVVEEPAVEPCHRLESDAAAQGHCAEQVAGQVGKVDGPLARLLQHAREQVVGQQAHVLGEHAEDQPVDEVRHGLRVVAAVPQRLRQRGEPLRRALGDLLPRLARPKPLGVGQRPLELVASGRVPQVFQPELMGPADAVGPVGADAEALQVTDDQQRRVLQRQRVLPQLPEGGVQVGVLAFVLPAEMAALPHVGPAAAAGFLLRAALEAVAARRWGRLRSGVGSPSMRHRSMKCSCAAERSFSSDACHLAMNSSGVMPSLCQP